MLEFEPDAVGPLVIITAAGRSMEAFDYKQLDGRATALPTTRASSTSIAST